jgi:hypothetical protein
MRRVDDTLSATGRLGMSRDFPPPSVATKSSAV